MKAKSLKASIKKKRRAEKSKWLCVIKRRSKKEKHDDDCWNYISRNVAILNRIETLKFENVRVFLVKVTARKIYFMCHLFVFINTTPYRRVSLFLLPTLLAFSARCRKALVKRVYLYCLVAKLLS